MYPNEYLRNNVIVTYIFYLYVTDYYFSLIFRYTFM